MNDADILYTILVIHNGNHHQFVLPKYHCIHLHAVVIMAEE